MLSIKCLKTGRYSADYQEVGENEPFAFWRIVEHTGAGWFPWPTLYSSREEATKGLEKIIDQWDQE